MFDGKLNRNQVLALFDIAIHNGYDVATEFVFVSQDTTGHVLVDVLVPGAAEPYPRHRLNIRGGHLRVQPSGTGS